MRVVSLLPSATEIVAWLGHEPALVGRSAECDYPVEIRNRPVVMRARFPHSDSSSVSIDQSVREIRGRGESLYDLDTDLLRELRPDALFTQDLCGVCSVTPEEVAEACRVAGIAPQIVTLTPRSLTDILSNVRTVAQALDDPRAGQRRSAELAAAFRDRRAPDDGRPSVAVVEWLDPPILAGLWTPEMIQAAGGVPVGGVVPGMPGRRTTWEELAESRPSIVVVSPCSFSVERTISELDQPSVRAGLSWLTDARLIIADEAHFSRPGPRLAAGLELLRSLVERDVPRSPFPVRSLELRTQGAAS
ncbi:MAG: cobalamin-binding protein [Thermoplasmata archaeon]|nr:cobalamin-binding protein [Thermoplasmata archaeon]